MEAASATPKEKLDVVVAPERLDRRLVVLMAVAVGLSVANLYYVQPLVAMLRHDFHVPSGVAALATTFGQLGYVAGLAALLPLGDLLERRRLIVVLSVACAASLVLVAAAPSLALLLGAMALVGVTSVVTQLVVPLAATLAPAHERGRVVGMVMSGLLLGILLARTLAGLLAQALGWRWVFVSAAGAMALVAVALGRFLPASRAGVQLSYGRLLASLVQLFKEEPVLRRRAGFGALSMGAFSVLWTSIALLLSGSPYHYGSARIGLFGLIGAAGALMASAAGRLADRKRVRELTVGCAVCIVVAYLALLLGASSLVWLIVGIVVLDVGTQGMHITNQSEIYRLRPAARTRLNSLYMTAYFIGGTLASALSAALYGAFGWQAVAAFGLGLGGVSLAAALRSAKGSPKLS
jgi:predicted MFS family arabinose efflux permease